MYKWVPVSEFAVSLFPFAVPMSAVFSFLLASDVQTFSWVKRRVLLWL